MDPAPATCSKCRAPLRPTETRGLCPACLLETSLSADDDADLQAPIDTAWVEQNQMAAPAAPEKAHRMGDYEILEEIGRGGMGVIYRARQISLRRTVAVKTLLTGLLASRDFARRFETEARAAAALDHPNIVPIHEVGDHQGQPYYSMPFIAGKNLAQAIKQDGPMPARQAATLLATVARAIHYAHQRGVLHRDLKPANILLDPDGQPHVTDFGLAKILKEDSGVTLTQTSLGTPNYMAPEQASGKPGDLTVAADIYSLGAILFEVLTGQRLFDAPTPLATVSRARDEEPPRPSAIRPSIARDLEILCLKCLEKDPACRYASAGELAAELDRFLKGEPILARPVGPIGWTWRWCRRKPVLAAMTGAVIALLLMVTVVSTVAAVRIAAEVRHAEQNARELRLNLYVADMNLAYQAVVDDNLGLARELVRKYLPKEGEVRDGTANQSRLGATEDLRGWEWRYLWGRCRGDSLATLRGHLRSITCALFSPDGKTFVTASFDRTVRIWDTATRRTLRRLTGFTNPIQRNSLALAPDGALLAVADGREIHVFEAATWNKLRDLPNRVFPGRVVSLPIAFAPDGRTLWCNAHGELRQWDTRSWEQRSRSLPSPVVDFGVLLALSPDGRRFATAVEEGVVVWEDSSFDAPQELFRVPLDWPGSVVFSPDGRLMAAIGNEPTVGVWDAETGRRTVRLDAAQWPSSVAFSPDGRRLVTGGGNRLHLWDLNQGTLIASRNGPGSIGPLAFSPDGQTLVSGNGDGTAGLWAARPGAATGRGSIVGRPLGLSEDGRRLVLLSTNSAVECWDVQSGSPVSSFAIPGGLGQRDRIFASPDGRLVAVVGTNRIARVWDLRSQERIAEVALDPPPRWPWAAFSPDGSLLAISCESRGDGGSGRTVVWDFGQQQVHALPDGDFYRPSFSADGRVLATGYGSQIQLWTVPGLKPLKTLKGHPWTIKSMAFSPDGSLLASAGRDRDIILWEVATGRQRGLLCANVQHNVSLARAFSADGRTLASSGGWHSTLWNVATEAPILTLKGVGAFMRPPTFSPDGNTLVVGGSWSAVDPDPIELLQAPSLADIEAAENAEGQSP